jgi:hypothetical protein
MKPFGKLDGGRCADGPAGSDGNGESEAGVENPMIDGPRTYNTLESRQPHERQLHRR